MDTGDLASWALARPVIWPLTLSSHSDREFQMSPHLPLPSYLHTTLSTLSTLSPFLSVWLEVIKLSFLTNYTTTSTTSTTASTSTSTSSNSYETRDGVFSRKTNTGISLELKRNYSLSCSPAEWAGFPSV